jgi:hypothetical protein
LRAPYREVAEYLAKDQGIYADDALVLVSNGTKTPSSGWVEYYFRKREYPIPAHVAHGGTDRSPSLQLFIKDGVYINPITIEADRLANYSRLYLVEVHEAFADECIGAVEKTYATVEDFPQFRDAIPESSFAIRFFKKLIRYRPLKDPVVLFGLRLYQ